MQALLVYDLMPNADVLQDKIKYIKFKLILFFLFPKLERSYKLKVTLEDYKKNVYKIQSSAALFFLSYALVNLSLAYSKNFP